MLSFRTADEAPLDAFLAVSAASSFQPQLREYADSLLGRGHTRPGWCVTGFDADAPVARAALWALPDKAVPSDVVLIDADWAEPDLAGGHALLERVHELAAALGAEQLQHHVDTPPGPPQYQEHDAERVRLLVEADYELLRDGLRWLHTPGPERKHPELTLSFRSLPEVGEEVFVEAFAASYEGTRDAWLTRNIREHGLVEAARADFGDYQQMDHLPEWWELAYTADDGALAGVIMGARTPSSAVVAYVGVVPQQRGRGFSTQLVLRGTDQLAAAGAPEIRGDCDLENIAMLKAFERAGFAQTARRRSYQRALTIDRRPDAAEINDRAEEGDDR